MGLRAKERKKLDLGRDKGEGEIEMYDANVLIYVEAVGLQSIK